MTRDRMIYSIDRHFGTFKTRRQSYAYKESKTSIIKPMHFDGQIWIRLVYDSEKGVTEKKQKKLKEAEHRLYSTNKE